MNLIQILDQFVAVISNPSVDIAFGWKILGWLYMVGFFIYVMFAVMVIRQIQMMSQTFTTPIRGMLLLFAFGHLLVAISIFALSFISLM